MLKPLYCYGKSFQHKSPKDGLDVVKKKGKSSPVGNKPQLRGP